MWKSVCWKGGKKKCEEPCCEERWLRERLERLQVAQTLSEEQHHNGIKICSCGGLRSQKKFLRLFGRKKRKVPELTRQLSDSTSDGNGAAGPPAVAVPYPPHMPVSKNSPHYNMTHPHRGKAIIFNFEVYNNTSTVHTLGLESRRGTQKDKNDLKNCLQKLEFDVHTYDNLGIVEFWKVLHEVRDEDHRLRDCLLVAIMTHGEKNHIYLSDGTLVPVNLVWESFHAHNCPTLAGKPKIFIIQACRGKNYDHGTRLMGSQEVSPPTQPNDVTDFASFSYVIPNAADIFVAFSCPLGHFSWRNPKEGTWFIQAICKVFSKDGYNLDLQSLFTAVGREVALNRESSTDNPETDKKRQVPSVSHTLIRTVMFTPKGNSPSFVQYAQVHGHGTGGGGGVQPLEDVGVDQAPQADGANAAPDNCNDEEIESSAL